jgi:hypothetical protein
MIPLRALAALAAGPGGADPAPRCELCASPLAAEHAHVVEIGARGLLCACRACGVLFARDDSGGRYRTVPDRVLADRSCALDAARWAELGVPVGLAFCVRDGASREVRIHYPGPAGVVDAVLAETVWDALAAATPLAGQLADDVEALLVRAERGQAPVRCYLVPISLAFALVGRLRATWQGFTGGDAAHQELAAFFADLDRRAGDTR